VNASAIAAFVSGLVFACGLALGGMTQPSKVVAFLDVSGNWDPSLAMVMGGALATHAVLRRYVMRRSVPLLGGRYCVPERSDIDIRLVAGAALFGVGWGLGGFCPGPALVAVGAGMHAAAVVVPAMLAGMFLHDIAFARRNPAPTVEHAVADG
jgi:uncharacterized membrane protein YedE/YeeE